MYTPEFPIAPSSSTDPSPASNNILYSEENSLVIRSCSNGVSIFTLRTLKIPMVLGEVWFMSKQVEQGVVVWVWPAHVTMSPSPIIQAVAPNLTLLSIIFIKSFSGRHTSPLELLSSELFSRLRFFFLLPNFPKSPQSVPVFLVTEAATSSPGYSSGGGGWATGWLPKWSTNLHRKVPRTGVWGKPYPTGRSMPDLAPGLHCSNAQPTNSIL